MSLKLRPEVEYILTTLHQAGYEVFLVGGAVRDLLLDKDFKDYDFTTNARPEQIKELFPESYYENEFGTVSITHPELLKQMGVDEEAVGLARVDAKSDATLIDLAQASKIHHSLQVPEELKTATNSIAVDHENAYQYFPDFEITTYRSQEIYEDFRHPDPTQLEWGESIEEDLARRDFTINALALNLQGEIIDPYQGQADLEAKLIKTVGEPDERFKEDALRMLRAIRFSVQLGFVIDPAVLQSIKAHSHLVAKISSERIRDEFFKILSSSQPKAGLQLLDETGLLSEFLPELAATKGVEQGGHHTTDVWTHSLDALANCPSSDPIVKLATLLHDIGKPATYQLRNGEITFYNHEIVGSRIADRIGQRLHLSKRELRRLFILVRHHMFYYQPENSDAAIRRFMTRVGLENIDDILALREGDRLGSGVRKTSWRLEEMKERIVGQLNQPMAVTDLAISGHDLMAQFDLKPGPWIGAVLDKLLEEVLDNPELNTKEQLLKLAQELV